MDSWQNSRTKQPDLNKLLTYLRVLTHLCGPTATTATNLLMRQVGPFVVVVVVSQAVASFFQFYFLLLFFFVARFVQVSSTSSFCAVYSQKTHINYARASKSHKMSNAANTKTKTQIATNEKTKHRQKSKKKEKEKENAQKVQRFFFFEFFQGRNYASPRRLSHCVCYGGGQLQFEVSGTLCAQGNATNL